MSTDEKSDYAPAASPQLDNVVRTNMEGIDARRTTLRSGDIDMPVYGAWPSDGPKGKPVVLVLSEAFGLHEHIADICRRFAKQGYCAIAPELMIRQGDPMSFTDIGALVNDLLVKIPDDQVMADIDICVEWAEKLGADSHRMAVTGYCWGGRWTWLYAAHRKLNAAVAWYGILDGRNSGLFPDNPALFPTHPLDIADSLKAPVLGLYGGRDEAIPLASVKEMEKRLETGSEEARKSEFHIYPEAGHAFFADYRDSYMADVAKDAWSRCLAWIDAGNNRIN